MKLQINLATRFYVDSGKLNLVISLMFVIVVIWFGFGVFTLMTNRGELQKFSEYKSRAQSQTAAGKISDAEFNRLLADIKSANAILDKRRYDWLTMLDNLELVVPDGVSLKGLSPSGKGDMVKLSATAKNFSVIRKFVENLESSSKFTDVFLIDQKFNKGSKGSNGIDFSVTCRALI